MCVLVEYLVLLLTIQGDALCDSSATLKFRKKDVTGLDFQNLTRTKKLSFSGDRDGFVLMELRNCDDHYGAFRCNLSPAV